MPHKRSLTDPATLNQMIERALAALPFPQKPHTLYAPMRYILQLDAKRMRPILVLWAYEAIVQPDAGALNECMPVALAVEVFHNFTLVHDDIMDAAPTRRGKPTIHTHWDSNIAILSGDALYAYSIYLLSQGPVPQIPLLTKFFAEVALIVCEGQALDMEFAQNHLSEETTLAAYLNMIAKKTAALVGGSLALGAICANASNNVVENLYQFGISAGIAFQLLDDLLDLYAADERFGKQIGGDILENKQTYLWLKALEKATPEQKAQLLHARNQLLEPTQKIQAFRQLYDALELPAETRYLIQKYFQEAQSYLQPLLVDYPALAGIAVYFQNILSRTV